MSKSENEEEPPQLILIRYGPYEWSGIVQHRLQRLYGLTQRLEELDYRIVLEPHDIWDHFDISYEQVRIFACRVTLFKYNCTWERDPICQQVVAAVQREVPVIAAALQVKQPPIRAEDFEVYPPEGVLYELLYGINLPPGPAVAVFKEVLDNVCTVDQNKIDFMKMLDEMFDEHRINYRICVRIKSIVAKLPLSWFQDSDLMQLMRHCIVSITNKNIISRSLTDLSEDIFQVFISNLARFMMSANHML